MPRRLPVRPQVIIGNIFVVLVTAVIGLIYYAYTFLVWLPKAEDDWRVVLLLSVFHVLFIMLVWSFIQSMTTDPGQVPVFWGFHLGDPENKRRRYCLMCNIFKPERCHHCSSCNRCVLNMDHHCPWINNCIGFWNRKFFILLLIYVLIVTYFVIITMSFAWLESIQWSLDAYYYSTKDKNKQLLARNIVIQVAFMLNGIIAVLMTMFLKFHIKLALSNKTTIENLEMKGNPYQSLYDISSKKNWEQVFGGNRYLWAFPVFCGSGKPLGDGIYWPTNRPEDNEKTQNSSAAQNRRQPSITSPQRNPNQGNQQNSNFGSQQRNANFGGSQNNQAAFHQNQQMAQQRFANNQGGNIAANQPAYAAVQQRYNAQQQMYQNHKNQVQQQDGGRSDLNSKIMENQARAAQLSEQINRQKAQIQQAKPKNARSGSSMAAAQAPAKKPKQGGAAGQRR